MCGIAGFISVHPAGPEEVAQVDGMLGTLQHRGPDGHNREVFGRAVLGHARLAIIDLTTGDQPQSDASGQYQVVCNGEIYNYKEIRADLEAKGHVFRTQSDIEVIPHLYEEMGDRCVERLRGMFAFALHDMKRDRTLLARDRLGKKPVHVAVTPQGTAFASELRALEVVKGVDLTVDPEAVDLFFSWQYIPAPWSIRRGIRKLPAGSIMTIEADGRSQVKRYWDPLPSPQDFSEVQTLELLEERLAEASRIRLRSDVPLSTFLSGGIDSGLVLSYLVQQAATPLDAVTVGFSDAPEDERPLTRATARALGVHLHEEVVDLDVAGTVEQVLQHLDEPLGDSSCVPTWIVSRVAAQRVKVVLSGDGGDESFGGYATRYGQNLAIQRLRRWLPRPVRRTVIAALARAWSPSARLPRPLRLRNVLGSLSRDFEDGYVQDMTILRPEDKRALYGAGLRDGLSSFDAEEPLRSAFERCQSADPLSRMLYVDRHTYLSEGVIAKVDRMSMAHSLEVRSPLLDQEVVELAAQIPSHQKIQGGVGKVCLRSLAARRLPKSVVEGRKKGFAPPLKAWIDGPLAAMVRDRLESGILNDWIDPAGTRALLDEQRSGARDNGRKLWLLLVLASWAETRRPAGVMR